MILFKCGFYYYLGMARPTDEDTTAIEKIACITHGSQEEGTFYAVGYKRSTSVSQEAERRGKCDQGSLL